MMYVYQILAARSQSLLHIPIIVTYPNYVNMTELYLTVIQSGGLASYKTRFNPPKTKSGILHLFSMTIILVDKIEHLVLSGFIDFPFFCNSLGFSLYVNNLLKFIFTKVYFKIYRKYFFLTIEFHNKL